MSIAGDVYNHFASIQPIVLTVHPGPPGDSTRMSGRTTTVCSVLVRRPLLSAVLLSLILHIPVLALLQGRLFPETTPEPGLMELMLAPPLLAQAEPQPPIEPAANTPATSAAATVPEPAINIPDPPLAADPAPEPVPEPATLPAIAQTAVQETLQETLQNTAPDTLLIQATTTASVDTQSAAASGPALPAAPPLRPLSGIDQLQLHQALQQLAATMALDAPFDLPDPQALGLSAQDTLALTHVPPDAITDLQQIEVTVTRQQQGRIYQMRARLQERALSFYAKFVNRWDDNVTLSNDRVDGRFHANSPVNFEAPSRAQPQFNGEVTIASHQSLVRRLRDSPMFAAGVRTGTGRIRLPERTLPAFWLETGATVLNFSEDTRLHFALGADPGEDQGKLYWTDIDSGQSGEQDIPVRGLLVTGQGNARFELSGQVRGQVLVYSPRRITVTGSLRYADPSQDMATLISDGSIEVAAASATGPGDLQIHAALFARERFSVRRFRDAFQGELYILGTLVAGSVSATEPRYHTRIEYDRRFEHQRPPAFPSTGLFDVAQWDQHWQDVSAADAWSPAAADSAAPLAP